MPFGEVLAAVVVLDRGGPDPPEVAVTVSTDHQVTLTWPDGLRADISLPGVQRPVT